MSQFEGLSNEFENEFEIDLSGLKCPMPVIKLKKWLSQNAQNFAAGSILVVTITDASAKRDLPAFCQQAGLGCECIESGTKLIFRLTK